MAGIKVSGGSKISFVMNPVLIESTQPVKSLNLKQRQCGIPSDIDKNHYLFKVNHLKVNPLFKPLHAQWTGRGLRLECSKRSFKKWFLLAFLLISKITFMFSDYSIQLLFSLTDTAPACTSASLKWQWKNATAYHGTTHCQVILK